MKKIMAGLMMVSLVLMISPNVFCQTAAGPIKIGALLPITGPFAMWGKTFKNNLEFALSEYGGQVAGRPVELLIEDEGGQDVTMALSKAKKLVESDKVGVMMGPFYTGSCLAVYPYTARTPIVAVKYASAGENEMAFDHVFSSGVRYNDSTYYLGQYVYDTMNVRSVTTIGSDFASGHDFMKGFVDGFSGKGGKVIQQQWAPLTETDYNPYLSALKLTDSLVSSCLGPQAKIVLFQQYQELGLFQKMPIILAEAGPIPLPVLQQMGDEIIGTIGPNLYLPSLDNEANKKFFPAYMKKFNQIPDNMATTAYAAMIAVLTALDATKGDTDAKALTNALFKLNLNLPQGGFSFNEKRTATQNLYISKIEKVDGKLSWEISKIYPNIKPYN